MRIAMIGGMDRQAGALQQLAEGRGHQLECHTGNVAGGGADRLRATVERAELVVVVTGVNSHSAMHLAKRMARQLGRPSLIMRSFGLARFRTLLDALETAGQRSQVA